jgi:DNA-binding CsgD family transcriptional regulator
MGEGFSAFVENIYEAAAEPAGWQRLAPALASLFQSDSCILMGWDTRSDLTLLAAATANFTADILSDYVTHYRAMDLWLASGLKLPGGAVRVGRELVDDDVMTRSEFYNDYLKKRLSHFDILGGMIHVSPHTMGFAAIHRPLSAPRFDAAHKRSLAVLMPHLTQAMRLHQRLAGVHRAGAIATAALDLMHNGVTAVGADRTLLFANAAAERLLSAGTGVSVQQGRLHCTDREADQMLGRLLQNAAGAATGQTGSAGGVLPAPRPQRRPLSLLVCPLTTKAMNFGDTQPAMLVFIDDSDDYEPLPAAALVRLYGLTPAEARLASLVASGLSPSTAAGQLGITEETARTVLKRVFAKVGVSRQAELAALLGRLAPR